MTALPIPFDPTSGFSRLRQAARRRLKASLPLPVLRWIQRCRDVPFVPPPGRVGFGDFRSSSPISRWYGYDRGRPIDRYFIEGFLAANAELVRGRVFEIGDDAYTRAFGGDRVTRSDVMHAYDVPVASIVGDLADLSGVPSDTFDCMIVTQTLQLIYDVRAALKNVYRVLKPGGVLLATVPGLTQIADDEWRDSWYWSFTPRSADRLLKEVFPPTHVTVKAHGNVLTSVAFLHGLADTELTREELDYNDRDYPMILTLVARKPGLDERHDMMGRWDYAGVAPFAYDADQSYRRGLAYLDGRGMVEDWGCGTAIAKRFLRKSPYVGIDGSSSGFEDKLADLQQYRSQADCIFMRHVLEHNYGWRLILANAVQSFRRRMVVVVFTPFAGHEHKIGENDGIPDLSLRREDVVAFFKTLRFTEETLESATEYGSEHIFYVERR
jgi:SAM-dependent methyltransferase